MRNLLVILLICLSANVTYAKKKACNAQLTIEQKEQIWLEVVEDYLTKAKADSFLYTPISKAKVDTLFFCKKHGIHINFSEEMAYRPLRVEDVLDIKKQIRNAIGLEKDDKIRVSIDQLPIEQYVPLYYANVEDKARLSKAYKGTQHVQNSTQAYTISKGLNNKHLALWNSHGRYYNHEKGIWKWQRAPLFSTVEDLFTSAYVLPFLVPMLENAGANVYLPRERDIQTHEVIRDNSDSICLYYKWGIKEKKGGYKSNVLLDNSVINPFSQGTHHILRSQEKALWQLEVPVDGNYAVYISYVSYKLSSKKAKYTVYHAGGQSDFLVNQRMGGGTWVYLGHFDFKKGSNAQVELECPIGKVSADAVRLGGGMGSIPREGQLSGVPRWQEAARYYLQYAGALDTLTYNRHNDTIDYNDDFRSRSRWVNYLKGGNAIEPWLLNGKKVDGLNIPIDLALGFHTDAGHFPDMDTTVGNLAIYSTYDVEKNRSFRSGPSRLSSRDLADLVQTQVTNDLRTLYDSTWTRRELWDKMYSEATFADMPSLLFEMHAHSNALDMRYGLDPQFRFDLSRAIYKAVLRFLATYYQQEYTVQPLPVSNFAINKKDKKWELSWEATMDSLEPSATPRSYIVYTRKGKMGWDNGQQIMNNNFSIAVTDTALYSFKVTAINEGGESFPSTILSAVKKEDSPTLLVVDGFTRVSAPLFMQNGDSVGLAPWLDEGVAWGMDIATIGWQYEYNQTKPWQSDDIPGHGGSHNDLANTVFMGNNFDHAQHYVSAIQAAGYNAVSSSLDAVLNDKVKLNDYDGVIFAFGEQRSTAMPSGEVKYAIYTPRLMQLINESNGKMIFCGAHIATDALVDSSTQNFINETLGFKMGTRMGDKYNSIFSESSASMIPYNVKYSNEIYRLEHVDGLIPINKNKALYTFMEKDAAVIINSDSSIITSSIPLECINSQGQREHLMKEYLDLLFDE